MKIQDTHIIVTGGSLGIGKETARLLVAQGAKVVITGRNKERLNAAATEIGAIPLVFDISDLGSIAEQSRKCMSLLDNKVDALINNAGIGVFSKFGELTIEDFQQVYNTNVFGLAMFTQEIAKHFIEKTQGSIINIGSTASQKGFGFGTIYASSKFAVRAMTQCWQAELRKYNIRVMLVNPSEVTTAFANESREERAEADNKLSPTEIAHTIVSCLAMENKGFIPEVNIWATNPF